MKLADNIEHEYDRLMSRPCLLPSNVATPKVWKATMPILAEGGRTTVMLTNELARRGYASRITMNQYPVRAIEVWQ